MFFFYGKRIDYSPIIGSNLFKFDVIGFAEDWPLHPISPFIRAEGLISRRSASGVLILPYFSSFVLLTGCVSMPVHGLNLVQGAVSAVRHKNARPSQTTSAISGRLLSPSIRLISSAAAPPAARPKNKPPIPASSVLKRV